MRTSFDDMYYDICQGNFVDDEEFMCDFEYISEVLDISIIDYYPICYPLDVDYIIYFIWILIAIIILLFVLLVYVVFSIFGFTKKINRNKNAV